MAKPSIPESSPHPFSRAWEYLTRPPYAGLPWVILLYVIVSCCVFTDNGPLAGHVVGFDDQVRMTQVLNWVNGAGWYDRLITRANAPEGFQSIWARIVDIPIAAVVVMAQEFVDQRSAALIASVVVPLIELAIMFWASRYLARPLAGRREAWLTLLFLMFTTVLEHKRFTLAGFHLGEASHHAWYGILNVLMFGAAVRIAIGVPGKAPRIMLGLAAALLLAVGIEGIPMIAGTVAILSMLAWAFRNPWLARRSAEGLGFGAVLSLALLLMHVPPAHFFEVSFIQPSIIGPVLMGCAAFFLAVQFLILRAIDIRWLCALLMAVVAGALALALVLVFPDILHGPTAGLSPLERQLAANEHPEVWTMLRVAQDTLEYFCLIIPTLIGLGAGAASLLTTMSPRRQRLYAAYIGLVAVPSLLAQFYWRYIHHALSTLCPLLLHAWQKIRARLPKGRLRRWVSFAAYMALGPIWMVFIPYYNMQVPSWLYVLFFPAKIYTEPYTCDTLPLSEYLSRHYSPRTLLNVPDWDSADFLYETNLRIDFIANYPSHDHFVDNKRFFQTQDMEEARRIAVRHGFNLVAMCINVPMDPGYAASRPLREPIMLERLKEGIPPRWLKPVETGVDTPYRLFAVDPQQVQLPQGKTAP